MKACVDVGNSAIKIGIFDGNKLIKKIILPSKIKMPDELEEAILSSLNDHKIDANKVSKILYSSVVPLLDEKLPKALGKIFKCSVISYLNYSLLTDLKVNVKDPDEIGGDLLADLFAVAQQYKGPSIIVDFGTATKILYLDKDNIFQTCLIMPGLIVSGNALTNNAALLPEVGYENIKPITAAKETLDAITNGVVYGHVEGVKGIVKRIEEETNTKCNIIITGGFAAILHSYMPKEYIYDENLNVGGLNLILDKYC